MGEHLTNQLKSRKLVVSERFGDMKSCMAVAVECMVLLFAPVVRLNPGSFFEVASSFEASFGTSVGDRLESNERTFSFRVGVITNQEVCWCNFWLPICASQRIMLQCRHVYEIEGSANTLKYSGNWLPENKKILFLLLEVKICSMHP